MTGFVVEDPGYLEATAHRVAGLHPPTRSGITPPAE